MRKTIICVFCLIASTWLNAQNRQHISDTRAWCADIDAFEYYQITGLRDAEFLDEAFIKQPGGAYGLLLAYFKNDTLLKIREIYGIRDLEVIAITEYYYRNGKLVFVLETENSGPDVVNDMDESPAYKIAYPEFKAQHFFLEGMLIYKLLEGEQTLIPNEAFFDSQSKEGQLLTASEKNMRLIMENYTRH